MILTHLRESHFALRFSLPRYLKTFRERRILPIELVAQPKELYGEKGC